MNKQSLAYSMCWYGHPACRRRGNPGHRRSVCLPSQTETDVLQSMPQSGNTALFMQQLVGDISPRFQI